MPNPAARPPEPARKVPDNLDALVRDAMGGGSSQLEKLKAAMAAELPREERRAPGPPREIPFADRRASPENAPSAPFRPAPPPDRRAAGPTPDLAFADRRAPESAPPAPSSPPGGVERRSLDPTPDLPFPDRRAPREGGEPAPVAVIRSAPLLPWVDRMVRAAQRAPGLTEDPDALLQVLLEVEDALSIGFASLPDLPPTLPPIRHAWLLVIPPFGAAEELGLSLGVDQATARMLSVGKWPRVGLRGETPHLGRRPGFDQMAISRDELFAVPQALGVLAAARNPDTPHGWLVTEETVWLADPQGGGVPAAIDPIRLIVPGEVETRVTREAPSDSRWLRKRLTAAGAGVDRRVRVIDLHTDGGVYRLVEGTTRTDGLPGHDPMSARKAFAAALDHLVATHPDAEVLEERLCSVGADGRSAWPAWEEHTRIARVYTEKMRLQSARV